MRALSWTTCLWPGLSAAWLRGQFRGLAVAIGFAGLLNLALVTTFVWPASMWAPAPAWAAPLAAWVLVLGFWIVGFRGGWIDQQAERRAVLASSTADDPQSEADLRAAQTEYLKGHWIEAETLLAGLLARRSGDVEARLLTASILRRTGRVAAAVAILTELASDERASRWRWEIAAERQRIEAARATPAGDRAAGDRAAGDRAAADRDDDRAAGPGLSRAA